TLRSFSASDAVVHTVDLSGLAARGDAAQGQGEPVHRSGQESLAEIANLSGGRLFKDNNDLGDALREIGEMSRRYYVLAFEPAALHRPGRFHKLRVRVRPRDPSVSHRSGYFERAPERERTPLEKRFEAAEVVAKGLTADDVPVSLLALPYRTPRGGAALPFAIEVQTGTLVQAGRPLGLEIYAYALDEKGAIEDYGALLTDLD